MIMIVISMYSVCGILVQTYVGYVYLLLSIRVRFSDFEDWKLQRKKGLIRKHKLSHTILFILQY